MTYLIRSEIIDGEQFPACKANVPLGESFNERKCLKIGEFILKFES